MAQIIPDILTASEEDYHNRLLLAEHVSDLIHVDIIDGKFADNVTIGAEIIKKYLSSSSLEIHIMAIYPQNYIDDLISVGHISRIIVPFEGESGLPEAIYHIKNHNMQVGLAINPQTSVKTVLHLLDDIDLLLLLSVEPGFSGQKFQETVIDKVKEAKKLVCDLPIEVDGGVNLENIPKLVNAGADFLAVNSALYKTSDFRNTYEKLAKLAMGS